MTTRYFRTKFALVALAAAGMFVGTASLLASEPASDTQASASPAAIVTTAVDPTATSRAATSTPTPVPTSAATATPETTTAPATATATATSRVRRSRAS